MIPSRTDAGESGEMDLPTEADAIQQRSDKLCRILWAGDAKTALQAARDLRSRLDNLAHDLAMRPLTAMERAKIDLARIVAGKAGAR